MNYHERGPSILYLQKGYFCDSLVSVPFLISPMKALNLAVVVLATFTATVFAKEVTLSGEGKCLKCALKKSDKCQNVLEVKKGDKVTLYKLTGDVSKKFHDELCQASKKIEVTGVLSEKDDEKSIEVAKIAEKK